MAAPMKIFPALQNRRMMRLSRYILKTSQSLQNNVRCFSCGVSHRSEVRVRFAPSPTGMLHLGGLRTALYNFLFAKSNGGKFILRIEDTDQTRLVPGALERLCEALQWAGLVPDEGPNEGGDFGPYVQSKRLELYQEKIQVLLESKHAYHCFCTSRRLELLRKEATRRGEVPKYDNRCRHLSDDEVVEKLGQGVPSVIRFKLSADEDSWEDMLHGVIQQNIAEIEGDPILIKSDSYPTYHFANIVDDHYMKITHVLRGNEWSASTMKHVLMYRAFGWEPPRYAHLPLIMNSDGTKLSKRQDDIRVESLQEKGYYPDAVLNLITLSGGGFKKVTNGMTLSELIDQFSIERMNVNSSRLEIDRINELNKLHLVRKIQGPEREKMIDLLHKIATDYMKDRFESIEDVHRILKRSFIEKVLDWSKERIHKLDELFTHPDYLFLWGHPASLNLNDITNTDHNSKDLLQKILNIINEMESQDFNQAPIVQQLRNIAKEENIKFPTLMKIMRLCISGLKEGPGVGEMMEVLGKDVVLERLQYSIGLLSR
ncbi:nondiscriminating glutamyl-tRNA synthetase EARS2, mitochondrial-like [Lineus longissimus]|uniref:nondiscriminating glutamyl-tRNA synthetase EARS2, mitochondrial-like n=1 Tax=Lineus longissimus TaxID=88925 RepID=UPI00315D2818